nr:proline-rich receptor-like protein kinase PERK9 [Aegilops tauschii subsp. strangulata]
MASDALRRGAPFRVSVILIAAALVRLAASAADAAERTAASGPEPDWHVVSVASLLPPAACTASKEPPPPKELAPGPSHPRPTSLTTSPRSRRPLPAIAPASCQRSLVLRRRRLPRPRAAVASPTPPAMPHPAAARARPEYPLPVVATTASTPCATISCQPRLALLRSPARHRLLLTPPAMPSRRRASPPQVPTAGGCHHRLGPVRHRLLPTPPGPTLLAGRCTLRERER